MTQSIKTLIERLEKLEKPCRQLDGAIVVALGLAPAEYEQQTAYHRDWLWLKQLHDYQEDVFDTWEAPAFTASFDAVLTLLPEGAEYEISTIHGIAYVSAPLNSEDCIKVTREDGNVILAAAECFLRARLALKSREAQT